MVVAMIEVLSVTRVVDGTDIRCRFDNGEKVTFHSTQTNLADPEGFALRAAVRMMLARFTEAYDER